MIPRGSAQLTLLNLAASELALSEERRIELVSALADLLLTVARVRDAMLTSEEDGHDREADI